MARKRFDNDQWVTVEALNDEGQGLAQVEGYTLEIDNALPGEAVRVAVLKRRGRILRCLALAVQKGHPDRIPALCPQAGRCGGCSQQHLTPERQRSAKQATLAALYEAAEVRPPARWLKPLQGPAWGYRRKARLGVRYRPREGDVLVGFRERGGWVSKASSCPVLAPPFATLLGPLKVLIRSLSIPDQIPQLELAAGDEGAAVVLRHLAPFTVTDLDLLRGFAEAQGLALYLQAGGPDTVTPLSPAAPPVLTYALPEFTLAFEFQPLDFTQVNSDPGDEGARFVLRLGQFYPPPRPPWG
jgi:23S rRNA (uracil1939-C5)-methyltransferase